MNTCAQKTSIRESLERLRPNVHSCLIYETPEEQLAAAVPLMELGLERGEKCIYLCDETRTGEMVEAMRERGIDTGAAIQSGALTVIPTRTSPGSGGSAAAFGLLAEAGRAANGTAVRLAREISCAPGELVSQTQIEEEERRVASCFTGKKYLDVELYNRNRVPPEVLLKAIRSHPVVIWDGTVCENLHAAARPDERLAPDPTAQEVERVLANLRDRQRIEDALRTQSRSGAILPVASLFSGRPSEPSPSGCGACLSQISNLQEQILHSEKMEALGRMASGMVHEFRNALHAMLGCSEMLIDRLGTDVIGFKLAKQISTTGRNANAIIDQLLAFSRPATIQAELLDLNSAVSDLEGVLRCSLTEQCVLHVVTAPVACPVKVDRGQLQQVLLNLVLNARDAMPEGGSIIIQTARMFKNADGPAPSGWDAEPVVALSITDTGFGMDANTQKRAFEPFFTTKDDGQGTGLGLSLVYGIVQQQFRGSISVESRPGMGTTVTVYIPLAEKLPD